MKDIVCGDQNSASDLEVLLLYDDLDDDNYSVYLVLLVLFLVQNPCLHTLSTHGHVWLLQYRHFF